MKTSVSTKEAVNCLLFYFGFFAIIVLLVILNVTAPAPCVVYGTEWSSAKQCCVYTYNLPAGLEPPCFNITTLCKDVPGVCDPNNPDAFYKPPY